jgi:IMP dehydrogenase
MREFLSKITNSLDAIGFDDLILLPGMSSVEPSEVDLSTRASKGIWMKVPFISSPMDTVTESEMAIAMARSGGIGIIHRNCSKEEQVEMVKRVKRAESFIIRDVITIDPRSTIKEAAEIMEKNRISGLPVVEEGKLVGIITGRDVRFADPSLRVADVMTRDVITAKEGIKMEEAEELMKSHKIEKLPVVDEEGRLKGLITYKDIALRGKYGNATRDEHGRLRVGAAISPFDLERAKELSKIADLLVIDVAHFHNLRVMEATKKLLKEVDVDVVAGNIGTYEAAVDIISSMDVAGLRVGIGSGSVCTTMEVTGVGAPTPFAVAQVADAVRELGADVPIIADGGIRGAGDIAISLALGASSVMMGYIFAGCRESPGELISIGSRYYKRHRGMGSEAARKKRMALDRYSQPAKGMPEGIEAFVPYRGEVNMVVEELSTALKAAFGYAGASSIEELWRKARLARKTLHTHERARDLIIPT